MIGLFLKLLTAHVIGDFIFQPTPWVIDKVHKKHKSPYLYAHVGVHLIATLVLLQFDLTYWKGIVFIMVTHLIIDALKLNFTTRKNERRLFVLDQVLHVSVLLIVAYYYSPMTFDWHIFYTPKVLLLLLSILILTRATAITMQVIMGVWGMNEEQAGESLDKAGMYIGMLERLFVFGFIVTNHWAGIGFLLAAKSVFRFSDISRAKDRRLTEYILIGTLLSFGIATITGWAYVKVLEYYALQ